MFKRTLILAVAVVLAACSPEVASEGETTTTTVAPRQDSTATVPSDTHAPAADAVLVAVTGALQERADGTMEICPGQSEECAGISVAGDQQIPDTELPVVRLTGWYDGSQLLVTDRAEPDVSIFADPNFATPCEGLQGSGSGNPPEAPVTAINEYTAGIPDRFAGMWWDQASSVMTVWLTGDDIDVHRAALEEAVGGDLAVCVIGGAEYSEAHLREIQMRIFEVIDVEKMAVWGTSSGTLSNRVEVTMEYLDAPTRARVEEEFGGAVELFPFLEVIDLTVEDLPAQVPARPGDVELVTQPNRAGGGMDALGTFEVRFDQELDCVFFPGDEGSLNGRRTVPVWPFGYTAEADPLRIYDQDGDLVAEEGDRIRMGGGFVGAEFLDNPELCGATGAWIMSSRPEVVEP